MKLVRHAITITNGLGHFIKLGATSDPDPPRPATSLSFPRIPPLKEASWQLRWWNTRQRAATHWGHAPRRPQRVPTPTHSTKPPGTLPPRAPSPHPSSAPRAGPPSQLPRSHVRTELGPSPAAPNPRVTFPITPSRLPACTPGGRSAERSGAASSDRGERPSFLSPSYSATAAALTPETELAGAKRL